MPAEKLARHLLGGIIAFDVPKELMTALMLAELPGTAFIVRPICNALFQRDPSCWIYNGVTVNPMSWPASKPETLQQRTLYKFHRMFEEASFNIYWGDSDEDFGHATLKGDDVVPIGRGVVQVGIELFKKQQATRAIGCLMPKSRAAVHFDTVFSCLDHDKVTRFHEVADEISCFSMRPTDDENGYEIRKDKGNLFETYKNARRLKGKNICMIEQELGNLLPFERPFATLLTMIEVDLDDPAFQNPTKFIGPVYGKAEADRLAAEKGWVVKADGDKWRRVVPSPRPKRVFELRPIEWLLANNTVVIAAGGGGIPTMYAKGEARRLLGVEAVIDKDLATELLARDLEADVFVMLTDADAVFLDWGKPGQRAIHKAAPADLRQIPFAAGSMGPKVDAACHFAEVTGKTAAIGALADLPAIIRGEKGTLIDQSHGAMSFY